MAEELENYTKKDTLGETASSLMARQERLIDEARDYADKSSGFNFKSMAGIGTLFSILAAADSIYSKSARRNVTNATQDATLEQARILAQLPHWERSKQLLANYSDINDENEAWNYYKANKLRGRVSNTYDYNDNEWAAIEASPEKWEHYQTFRDESDNLFRNIKHFRDKGYILQNQSTIGAEFAEDMLGVIEGQTEPWDTSIIRGFFRKLLGRSDAQDVYSREEISKIARGRHRPNSVEDYEFGISPELYMSGQQLYDWLHNATAEERANPNLFKTNRMNGTIDKRVQEHVEILKTAKGPQVSSELDENDFFAMIRLGYTDDNIKQVQERLDEGMSKTDALLMGLSGSKIHRAEGGFKDLKEARTSVYDELTKLGILQKQVTGEIIWKETPAFMEGYIGKPQGEDIINAKLQQWWVSGTINPQVLGVSSVAENLGFMIDDQGIPFIDPKKAIAPAALNIPVAQRSDPELRIDQLKTIWNMTAEKVNMAFINSYGSSPSKGDVFPPQGTTQQPLWVYNGNAWVKTPLGRNNSWENILRELFPPSQ